MQKANEYSTFIAFLEDFLINPVSFPNNALEHRKKLGLKL